MNSHISENARLNKKKHARRGNLKIGHLCWFINGTICSGTVQASWKDKMTLCRSCEVFQDLL